jgi:hypothetical protein
VTPKQQRAYKLLPCHATLFYSGLPMPAVSFEGAERFKLESRALHPVRAAPLASCLH